MHGFVPYRVYLWRFYQFYTLPGIIYSFSLDFVPVRVYYFDMKEKNKIAVFVKEKRREAKLTQKEFALRSGLGLRFVRELEQGKETLRMDKVNQALSMFGMEAVPGRIPPEEDDEQ